MKQIYRKRKRRNLRSFLDSKRKEWRLKKRRSFKRACSFEDLILLSAFLLAGLFVIAAEVRFTGDRGSVFYLLLLLGLFISLVWTKRKEKKRMGFYAQLEEFISNLQMYYGYYGDMEEAIYEASVASPKKVYPLGKWLYEALKEDNAGKERNLEIEAGERFGNSQGPYVILLYEICKTGVHQEMNMIAIQAALRRFKEEIREIRFKQSGLENGYRGLLEICLLTGFALPFARDWGASNLEELRYFYEEGPGRGYLLICLFCSISMFFFLYNLRFEEKRSGMGNWLGKIPGCYALGKRILSWLEVNLRLPWRCYKRKIEEAGLDPPIYYLQRIFSGLVFLAGWFLLCIFGYVSIAAFGQFLFKGLVFGLLFGAAGSFLPTVFLFLKRLFISQYQMAEILRFYNWLLLEKENPGCCLERILEGFLYVADVFKRKTDSLFYQYMQKGFSALEQAREGERYMPFARILEGLILCDSISMEAAFGNFETERAFYLEQLRKEQEESLRDSVALGKMLAFVPLYALMLLMLIIPFVTQGLSMLQSYREAFL